MSLLIDDALRLVYTTVSNLDSAKLLAQSVVEMKLAACVNITHIESVYFGGSEVKNVEEYSLLMKTRNEIVENLVSFVNDVHPYDVPAIIVFPACSINYDFFEFVKGNTIEG